MGDTWNDATQSYENETGGSTITEITNISNDDLLTLPETSDANLLIKLVNNSATNTNNLYILQANPNGEIRFLTKDAYLNNDVDENDGNLYYNAKIGADGKLYLYWTYDVVSNPIYFSGWKDIMSEVAVSLRDINLIGAGIFVLEGQVATAIGDIITINGIVSGHTGLLSTHTSQIAVIDLALADLTTIVVNMASMKSFTHQGWSGWKRRGNVKDAWSRMSDRYNFTPSSTSATGITTAGELFSLGGTTGAETATIAGLTSRVASEGGSAMNIALGASKKFLDGLGYAFIGAGIVGGISALAYTYDKQGAVNDEISLPFLYDVRAGIYNDSLKSAGDPTKKTLLPYLIHKNGLTISAGTNNGFTTAGIYEYAGNASYPEMSINIIITAGLVAEIASVVNSGTKVWAVGNTIVIPKASIGGTSGNLTINVNTIYTATEIVDLHIAETQARIEKRDKKMRRRSNVVIYDDIDTAVFTNTTDTEAYTDYWDTQETLTYKKLKSRLNLLPTGTSDVDVYTSTGKIGIGTTPETTLQTYHATDNILRLETGTTGTNSIQFRRGAVNDIFTDYRLISEAGVFKLQYEDDTKAYGDTGTNIIWGSKDNIVLHKNTEIGGNVGIGTTPATNLHIYGATANTLLLETGGTGLPIIEFRKATTTDTNTDYRFISDAGGIFKFQFNNNIALFGASANASDIWNARVDRMVIYKNTTITANCGIGGANPHATYKLNVGGDVNISAGSVYRIGTNPLSYNDLTDQLVSGANITIDGNVISCAPPNTLAEDIDGIVPVEHGGTGRNDIGMYAIPFGNTDETAYTWTGDFKYNQALGRLGVNVLYPAYALDVNGDMNIPATSNYRIGGNPLSYNDLADKLTAGTNITITSGVIDANVPAQLTAGTGITITSGAINATTQLTAGTNIDITSGVISANVPAQLTAGTGITIVSGAINATTQLTAGTNIDITSGVISANVPAQLTAGTNIDITSGVISANVPAQLTAGTNITITSGAINAVVPTTFDAGAITSGTLALSRGGTGGTTIGAGAIPIGNATQNAYTWTNNFKYDITNSRLGLSKAPLYVLDVAGDVNISTGYSYRVNGTALTFTNLSGTCPVSKGGTGLSVVSAGVIPFGNATSDAYSWRVLLNWDDTNLRLGVNKTAPAYTIDSGGDINIASGSTYRIGGTALSYTNLTNQLTAGTNVSIVSGAINANITSISASAITSGTLAVDRGGTGNSTITSGNILYGNGTSAIGNNTSFKYLLGCLGVNMTGNPFTTLHIGTGGLATAGTYYVWFDYFSGSSLGFTNSNRTGVCAYLQGSLWLAGGRFIASSSDVRIKHEIEDINDDSALQMILAVEPKTYKYLDKLAMGNKKVYGFIAQQIKEVIPNAINIQKEIIPNIMLLADYNESIITLPSLPSAVIKVGDKVRCYDKRCKEIIAVVEEVIDTLTFKLAPLGEGQTPPYIDNDNKIFIYGTEIDDFHTIDKNYIYTLNVCATQELHRKIVSQEQRIAELEAKVERLLNYLT